MTTEKIIAMAVLTALMLASYAPIVPRYNIVIRHDILTGWSIRIEKRTRG